MGDVAATIKVMPESPEVDLDDLEEELSAVLPEGARISGTEREEVAFGLVALLAAVVVPDSAGGTEAVEEAFADLQRVESVSVEDVGRL
jgi:elongation factor 1-beta